MNAPLNSTSSAVGILSALPLHILARIELGTLKFEHRRLVRESAALDAWYVHTAGETTGPERIAEVFERLVRGESNLAIIHASSVENGADGDWHLLTHQAWCLDRATALVWIIGFWSLAILFGWVLLCALFPISIRSYVQVAYFLTIAAAGIRIAITSWQNTRRMKSRRPATVPLDW